MKPGFCQKIDEKEIRKDEAALREKFPMLFKTKYKLVPEQPAEDVERVFDPVQMKLVHKQRRQGRSRERFASPQRKMITDGPANGTGRQQVGRPSFGQRRKPSRSPSR